LTRTPLQKLLLIAIILWCALLVTGSVLWAFMGMLFAGEPAGGGIGAYELMMMATPLVQTGILSAVLITLWRRGYYAWAAAALLLSVAYAIYRYHGYVL
jgi:hypothetical protein